MYGFNVSGLIGQLAGTQWGAPFYILKDSHCNILYSVDLKVKYGCSGIPSPSLTDSLVLINEGQKLSCKANLEGGWGLNHPVTVTIKDDTGKVVFTATKWLIADYPSSNTWSDMFSELLLPVGAYTATWQVCEKSASHDLTVHSLGNYTTNDVDVNFVVTSTAGINPYDLWNAIGTHVASRMLVYATTVKLKSAETVGAGLVVFHLEVTAPVESTSGIGFVVSVPTLILVALFAIIAGELVAIPAWSKMKIAEFEYNRSTQRFITPDGKVLYHDDYVGYMAVHYPDVWADIKDYVTNPSPPPPEPDWMDYITYAFIAIFGLAGLYISLKYIFPALKGR